jgi:alpha-L-rhamnosidase/acyl-CoA thioesterase-1
MKESTQFIRNLEAGLHQTVVLYGTSLSYHLAPLLRDSLTSRYGELITIVNSGLSGKASRSGLRELEAKVLRHKPDALFLEFATNDSHDYSDYKGETIELGITPEESRSNLETLIESVQDQLPACEIILQTMNPTYDSPLSDSLGGSKRAALPEYFQGYRRVALARGLKLIDNYQIWQTLRDTDETRFKELIPDGVHPTPAAIRSVLVPHLLAELGLHSDSSELF